MTFLLLILIILILAAAIAWYASTHAHRSALKTLAVDHNWELLYTDIGGKKTKLLMASTDEAHVVGRPDRVYRIPGTNDAVVVEDKSRVKPRFLYDSHRMQLGCYVLMAEATLKVRVVQATVQYSDGSFDIPVTEAYKAEVRALLDEMAHVTPAHLFRNHDQPGRCYRCEYRTVCPQSLAPAP